MIVNYDFNLSVWQTEECTRCGGCCYVCVVGNEHYLKLNNTLCDKLIVNLSTNNTSCRNYDQTEQPKACREYFCGRGKIQDLYAEVFGRLLIARVVLDVFQLKPVKNAEEIRGELEEIYARIEKI